MTEKAAGSDATMPQLPQGDLGLLESETAKRLLGSGIPDLRGGAARAPPRRPAGGQPGTRMAGIAVRPSWVGLVDFQTHR
jgi:hypothetical protein